MAFINIIIEHVCVTGRAWRHFTCHYAADAQESEDESSHHVGSAKNPYAPMEVLGDINEDGLGCISWWETAEDGQEDDPAMDVGD